MELQRVSTNATLLLRIAVPVMWISFFGAFTFMALIMRIDEVPMMQSIYFKTGLLIFFLTGLLFIRFTFLRLKRVDMSKDHFLVTNYLKTYKYTFDSLQDIDELDFLLFKVVKLTLREKGSFGKKIFFLPSTRLWNDFIKSNPYLFEEMVE
jgi:hypothetical protein